MSFLPPIEVSQKCFPDENENSIRTTSQFEDESQFIDQNIRPLTRKINPYAKLILNSRPETTDLDSNEPSRERQKEQLDRQKLENRMNELSIDCKSFILENLIFQKGSNREISVQYVPPIIFDEMQDDSESCRLTSKTAGNKYRKNKSKIDDQLRSSWYGKLPPLKL